MCALPPSLLPLPLSPSPFSLPLSPSPFLPPPTHLSPPALLPPFPPFTHVFGVVTCQLVKRSQGGHYTDPTAWAPPESSVLPALSPRGRSENEGVPTGPGTQQVLRRCCWSHGRPPGGPASEGLLWSQSPSPLPSAGTRKPKQEVPGPRSHRAWRAGWELGGTWGSPNPHRVLARS